VTALLLIWVLILFGIMAEQRGQIRRLRTALREARLDAIDPRRERAADAAARAAGLREG